MKDANDSGKESSKNSIKDSIKVIKFRNKFFHFPGKKIKENSNFFRFHDKLPIELKEENKEFLEKFIFCFNDELLDEKNINNFRDIIDLCLHYKVNDKLINNFIEQVQEQSSLLRTNNNPIILSKNYNLMEFEEKNIEFPIFPEKFQKNRSHFYK